MSEQLYAWLGRAFVRQVRRQLRGSGSVYQTALKMANPRYHWSAWKRRTNRPPRACDEKSYQHQESRQKVTMRDFLAHRFKVKQGWHQNRAWGKEHAAREFWAYLMSSPLGMERPQSREQCRLNPKQLASKAAKFLTLSAEYAHRHAWDKARHQPIPQTEPFGGRSGYGDTKAAKSYHARRVAEYRALQAEQFRQAA